MLPAGDTRRVAPTAIIGTELTKSRPTYDVSFRGSAGVGVIERQLLVHPVAVAHCIYLANPGDPASPTRCSWRAQHLAAASARVRHKPRLLSDNGSSYVPGDLAKWLEDTGMHHIRGPPGHAQTQGKIERWHQTLKNRILLKNYCLPGDLEAHIGRFVDHYNHRRYHASRKTSTWPTSTAD